MVIAGLTGYGDTVAQTANLIYAILNSYNKKVSILDCKDLKDVKTLKSYIQEIKRNYSDFLILKLDINSLEQELLGYIQFDIILYNNETDPMWDWKLYDYNKTIEKVLPFLSDKCTVILNEDFLSESSTIKNLGCLTVTYGFNSNAEVTTSSISDTLFGREFIFYQQKTIETVTGKYVYPQEYRINTSIINADIYVVLSVVTFLLVSGVELKHNIPVSAVYGSSNFSASYERNFS